MNFPGWTREPLVHFLVAGALIFAFFTWRGVEPDPASRSIDIDREVQAQIAIGFERLMGRAPTDAELDAQIDRYVREEVLYREALRLGLDQDDAIVRRRLAQKMDLLASAQAETAQPSEEVLRQWYDDHPERFSDEVRYTLDQVWFAKENAAQTALGRIADADIWREIGGEISLPPSLENADRTEVTRGFGEVFVQQLMQLEPDEEWQGPLRSGLGWHLVRLRAVEASQPLPFDEYRDEVLDDWRSATIAERREEAYRVLRDAYQVEIDR